MTSFDFVLGQGVRGYHQGQTENGVRPQTGYLQMPPGTSGGDHCEVHGRRVYC